MDPQILSEVLGCHVPEMVYHLLAHVQLMRKQQSGVSPRAAHVHHHRYHIPLPSILDAGSGARGAGAMYQLSRDSLSALHSARRSDADVLDCLRHSRVP